MSVPTADAIPAFARKYTLNCTACHTAPPQLNTFGERFLENGYQLPGTEDGGITGKKNLGDLSLDDFANYTGVRLRGNAFRTYSFKRQNPPGAESGSVQNKSELGFPEVFSLFTAGTLAKNIGFFVELESNLEESRTGIERAFITFNNIGERTSPTSVSEKSIPPQRCHSQLFGNNWNLSQKAPMPPQTPSSEQDCSRSRQPPNFMACGTGQEPSFHPTPLRCTTRWQRPGSRCEGGRSAIGLCIRSAC